MKRKIPGKEMLNGSAGKDYTTKISLPAGQWGPGERDIYIIQRSHELT